MAKRHNGEDNSASAAVPSTGSRQSPHPADDSIFYLVTGSIALGLCFIILLTSLPPIKKRFYEVFYYTHHLFVATVVLSVIHSGISTFWIIGIAFYCSNKLYNFVSIKKYTNKEVEIEVISEKTITISFPKKKSLVSNFGLSKDNTGKYIYVCCPKISILQWHAFDLTDGSDGNFDKVIIGANGDWTRKFYHLLSEDSKSALDSESNYSLLVSKPFTSMHSHIFENDVAIIISGGTGIAPMIPIINKHAHYLTTKKRKHSLKKIHLVWICREASLFGLLEEPLNNLISKGLNESLTVTIYYTGSKINEAYVDQHHKCALFDLPQVSLIYSKPDLYDVYTEIITKYESNKNIGIVAVANESLTEQAKRISRKWGRENKRAFRVNFYSAAI
ncbi:hypothetical protein BB561_006830 [Smittium simulii]|uniref:FAD-binding FR-type domain-containing protein n=1 Tax=Smittium simulii TaxID=133385 RepID=A0A2T9Y133_9FUNG|nr:hypothetical protein BB561_006830 [Smittium simulii]